ncbi:MAG: peptidoglycan DD-metalloendopeptidase family protein [Gammaproteobacteria bacterium]
MSPIRHDYKHTTLPGKHPPKRLPWFATGLGIPLACVALLVGLRDAGGTAERVTPNDMQEAVAASLAVPAPTLAHRSESLAELLAPPASVEEVIVPYTPLTLTVASGDTLDRLFRRHSLSIADLHRIVGLPEAKEPLRVIRPGEVLQVRHDNGRLRRLYKELDLTSALVVEATGEGFEAKVIERPIELRETMAHGVIETSLFEAAMEAGVSDNVVMNLAGIFAWDIDFVLDIRKGDEFFIIYEEIWQDGEFVANGDIVAAEFVNRGNSFAALRFVDPEGESDYYTPEGRSVRKAFIRAPVDFSRISSNFNPNRRHPVLNTTRAHRGVDYAAPTGTPIKAAGDGKVIFRGRKGGYGNTVILQHGGNITTLYAHMSRFNSKAKIGSRVRQGQVIGYVGATGMVTGAHLHYEYRLNGVHRNPRTVELPEAEPIRAAYRDDFLAAAEPLLKRLDSYRTTRLASIQ